MLQLVRITEFFTWQVTLNFAIAKLGGRDAQREDDVKFCLHPLPLPLHLHAAWHGHLQGQHLRFGSA